jgi:hypothetical protein
MARGAPDAGRASLDERVDWHLAHAENCGCRAMPQSIVDALKRRRIEPRRVWARPDS